MKVLVIAPHHDDEILGVGGTMARLVDAGNEVFVCVVTTGKRKTTHRKTCRAYKAASGEMP